MKHKLAVACLWGRAVVAVTLSKVPAGGWGWLSAIVFAALVVYCIISVTALMWVAVVAFVLSILLYVCVLMWAASKHVEGSPKAEVFMCDIHGPLPVGATLVLFEDMEYHRTDGSVTHGPIRGCPICFEGKIKHAQGRS